MGDDGSPRVLRPLDRGLEVRGGQQRDETRVLGVRIRYAVQELRADDASAPPDLRNVTLVDVPVVLLRARDDRVEALAVRDHFGRVERAPNILDELRLVG